MIERPLDRASNIRGNVSRYFPGCELASPAESLESWFCLKVYIEMLYCQQAVLGARVLIELPSWGTA